MRQKLPNEREAVTHRFKIGEIKGYVTVGLYADGRPGEIFVKMDRQGSTVSGFVDAWAIAVSMLLQTGTSLETVCEKFRGMTFDPSGMTGRPEIPFARSPIDYVCRWLERKYIEAPEAEGEPEPRGMLDTDVCEQCGAAGVQTSLRRGKMKCDRCAEGKK